MTDVAESPQVEVSSWVARAEELAETFHGRCPALEESATLPIDHLKAISDAGFDTAWLPPPYGTGEATLSDFGGVVRAFARACPCTATVWLMHVGAATGLVALSEPDAAAFWAERLANGARFSNALSEPTGGNQFLVPIQEGVPVEGGWTLTGAKRFVSGSEAADHLLVNASIDGVPTFFGIDRDDTLTYVDIWDSMGMRGTRSQLLSFNDTFLPAARSCRAPRPEEPNLIWLGLPWLSIGIADAAFGEMRKHVTTRTIPVTGRPLAEMQWVQFDAAEAVAQLEAGALLAERSLQLAEAGTPEWFPAAVMAKMFNNQMAKAVADLALRAGGGSCYLKTSPIERHFRNAQAGALMAFSVEVSRDLVGKTALGLADS